MDNPQKILIIDDEEDMRDSCARILEKTGLHVDTAPDGPSGLSLIERKTYDLILLDLILPESDGLTLLRHIKAKHLETPVIVISAYGTVKTAVEAMKLGAMDLIEKPADIETIAEKIKKAQANKMILVEKKTEKKIRQIMSTKAW